MSRSGVRGVLVAVGIAAAGWAVAGPAPAVAKDAFLDAARAKYPAITGTQLDDCSLCHTSAPSLNPYGKAYRAAGRSFNAIRRKDSDGDGFRNIREIRALTFPGRKASHP
jgi:mono/diheme cytochrome c family protein